jgi:hypothetical protein
MFDKPLLQCPNGAMWTLAVSIWLLPWTVHDVQNTVMCPNSPLYRKVEMKTASLHNQLWTRLGMQGYRPAPAAPAAPPVLTISPETTGMVASIANASNSVADTSSAGRKEREHDEFSQSVGDSWSIFFGTLPTSPECTTLVCATLSSEFTGILATTNDKKARATSTL